MRFTEQLRKDADEQLEATGEILKQLQSEPNSLRAKLLDLSQETRLETIRVELAKLVDTVSSGVEHKRLVAAITGAVTANVYSALADLADYFVATGALKRVSERLHEYSDLNKAINLAASSGNYDAFDRIIDNIADKVISRINGEPEPELNEEEPVTSGASD